MPSQIDTRRALLYSELLRTRDVLASWPTVYQLRVFGSMASGTTHAWSDLDLAIIADSDQSFLERSKKVAQAVAPRVGIQFLVYTPAEMQAVRDRPFIRTEILEKGLLMPLRPQEEGRRWLAFAKEDLQMATLALNQAIYNQVCFHAQQCVEKSLKGCLAAESQLTPRTHLLVDLYNHLATPTQAALFAIQPILSILDQLYIPTRYPDALPDSLSSGAPAHADAVQALQAAQTCFADAQQFVG